MLSASRQAGEARALLDSWGDAACAAAPLAYSRALIETVALAGAEEESSRAAMLAALRAAVTSNPYVALFLAQLDSFAREIDPTDPPPPARPPPPTFQ